jgi:N-acetylmuramoyl-L-alanine amidase
MYTGRLATLMWLIFFCAAPAHGGDTIRVSVELGVSAALKDGHLLFLECRGPRGTAAREFFAKYLADPDEWKLYKDRMAVAIPFRHLKPQAQRTVLLTVFPEDVVDASGWWHTVQYAGQEGQETIRFLCEWTTGKEMSYRKVIADERNPPAEGPLARGRRILIPAELLLDVMKTFTGKAVRPPAAEEQPTDLDAVSRQLRYGSDDQGTYAEYHLKPGEALYTAVVVRFTDFRDNDAIRRTCEVIRRRSGIKNVHEMQPGQRVLIPLDMLSDRFTPKGSEPRKEYEATLVEAKRLRKEHVRTKDLEGVVVMIDPGHGGRDRGAANLKNGLYEDELNYDIACRVKKILEQQTRAKVYITVKDLSQRFEPVNKTRFTYDTDEVLLTTPPYDNSGDSKISANLRWYLANSIYRAELKKGADPRKMVFTSFHTDALYNSSLRGAMIYIPGATYRREREEPQGEIYCRFKEVRERRGSESTTGERRRDEALSRNFAEDVMQALGKRRIRRHLEGDWIRSQIRQDGGLVYVPAVLRNTLIPTKILIEAANMTNSADCARLADPQWRQSFAEAYVDALETYFGS